jgi:predicted RecA/RadA family phage recombinase
MADALYRSEWDKSQVTAAVARASGEIIQLSDGRAAYVMGLNARAIGDAVGLKTSGVVEVTKTASIVFLDGGKVYWDRSANAAHFRPQSGDFFIGTAYGDAAAADTTLKVNLNVDQSCQWELGKQGDRHTTVLTTTAGSPTVTRNQMGYYQLLLESNDEAECVDILSDVSIPKDDGPIFETRITFDEKGDNAAVDTVFGLVNASHTSDADSITESVLFSQNGNDSKLNCESDDGTTEVAATDSTVVLVEDTSQEFWIDGRDPEDMRFYIDGVEVLNATANLGDVDDATGPFKALVLVEKSGGAHVPSILVDWMRLRSTDLATARI